MVTSAKEVTLVWHGWGSGSAGQQGTEHLSLCEFTHNRLKSSVWPQRLFSRLSFTRTSPSPSSNNSPHPERCIAATFSLYSSTVFPRYQVEWTDPLSLQPPSSLPPPSPHRKWCFTLLLFEQRSPFEVQHKAFILLSCYFIVFPHAVPRNTHRGATNTQGPSSHPQHGSRQ